MMAFFAGPFAKLLGIFFGLAILVGIGEWHGRSSIQQRWDASLTRQALRSADTIVEQAKETAQVEVRYIKLKGETKIVTNTVEKEVIRYVDNPNQTCRLSPEFERTFDVVSRLRDASPKRVPASADPSGESLGATEADLTDAEVLLAYHDAVTQLYDLWNAYDALVGWVRMTYQSSQHGSGHFEDDTES